MKKIDIFDSTLRDGAQGEGISFSVEDKLADRARCSTGLGVAYIEAGNPRSNPKDVEFFRRAAGELPPVKRAGWWRSARPAARARRPEEDTNVRRPA